MSKKLKESIIKKPPIIHNVNPMTYSLPPLPYSTDALEPYIDAKTMEIHHGKHHQGYINKLNGVLEKYPDLSQKPLEDLLRDLENLAMEPSDKILFKNNAGGHLNHSLFWEIMGPKKEVDENLLAEIQKTFGSVESFKKLFEETAIKHFGSGWAWLVRDSNNILQVYSLPNQDSPFLQGHQPLIGLDVWEHAYYLQYQNRRDEYVKNWWNVLRVI